MTIIIRIRRVYKHHGVKGYAGLRGPKCWQEDGSKQKKARRTQEACLMR